jgi:hypothetical protein
MKVEDTDRNSSRCMCPGCPTYNDCMREQSQRIFCARGATDCDPDPQGCICGECAVWSEYGLGSYYFCTSGAAS